MNIPDLSLLFELVEFVSDASSYVPDCSRFSWKDDYTIQHKCWAEG